MVTTTFLLKVITPAGSQHALEVRSVTVPTSDGEISVFAQHAPYHGLLGTGVMVVEPVKGPHQMLVVSGGICSFDSDNSLSVLADLTLSKADVDLDSYANDRVALTAALSNAATESPEFESSRRKLSVIEAVDSLVRQ